MERIPYTYRLYCFLHSVLVDSEEYRLRWLPVVGEMSHTCPKLSRQEWENRIREYIEILEKDEYDLEQGNIDECEGNAWALSHIKFDLCFGNLKPLIDDGDNIFVEFECLP